MSNIRKIMINEMSKSGGKIKYLHGGSMPNIEAYIEFYKFPQLGVAGCKRLMLGFFHLKLCVLFLSVNNKSAERICPYCRYGHYNEFYKHINPEIIPAVSCNPCA